MLYILFTKTYLLEYFDVIYLLRRILIAGVRMTALIMAPECKLVKLSFTVFKIYGRVYQRCYIDRLELTVGDDLMQRGTA